MPLLFDLDGTLTDPSAGIVACTRHALEALGHEAPDDGEIASFIGPPLRHMLRALLQTTETRVIEAGVALYRERYRDVGLFEARVHDGVPDMLRAAHALGGPLFVATGKPTEYATRVLQHFGLADWFTGVYGNTLDGRYDDKAVLLRDLLEVEQLGGLTVMIGDRSVDIVAATSNALPSIGVLWGFGSAEELTSAGAHQLCPTPLALEDCLGTLPA